MSQKPIPDFTETELWVVRTTLKERYGKDIPIELAEAEIMLGGRPATSLHHRTIQTIP